MRKPEEGNQSMQKKPLKAQREHELHTNQTEKALKTPTLEM